MSDSLDVKVARLETLLAGISDRMDRQDRYRAERDAKHDDDIKELSGKFDKFDKFMTRSGAYIAAILAVGAFIGAVASFFKDAIVKWVS